MLIFLTEDRIIEMKFRKKAGREYDGIRKLYDKNRKKLFLFFGNGFADGCVVLIRAFFDLASQ